MTVERRHKTFKGWAFIKSKNGSNWGQQMDENEWPIVSPLFKHKSEVMKWRETYRHDDCMPTDIRKVYR